MSNEQVYLIKNSTGADKCPAGKLALYTNINFNGGEIGDILIMSPDVELDKAQLESYGFILGEHDGVSSVVNNMDQDATLVSGLYLDGQILTVKAGTQIKTLVDFPLGAKNWNDAVNSVVSAGVDTVNVTMSIEDNLTIQDGEVYSALLLLRNNSSKDVNGAVITATTSNASVFTIQPFTQTVNIPAKGTATVRIPLEGEAMGTATLTCTLNMPFGIINNANNMSYTTVRITEPRDLEVTQQYLSSWQDTWPSTDYLYSYKLMLSSAKTRVVRWELSFILPEKAKVYPQWLESESSWISLNVEKSVNGNIYLDSQSGHTIDPGKSVELDIQILYPNQSEENKTLKNLRLVQLA
ncbi:peptidase inhibitor family I36 protein [unidentified bacterial endosymbiont]|uniref:peptidase inhibitor family I36 protein n=1 Tax=unidentified bacterial endosymbiont TaxID=2355 RepID=UPI00209FA3D2|nr:peptidase inhibitor family I36 protein [unidentified bacterial endosymbiont]